MEKQQIMLPLCFGIFL